MGIPVIIRMNCRDMGRIMDQKRRDQIVIILGVIVAITAIPRILSNASILSYSPVVAGIILVLIGIAGIYKS